MKQIVIGLLLVTVLFSGCAQNKGSWLEQLTDFDLRLAGVMDSMDENGTIFSDSNAFKAALVFGKKGTENVFVAIRNKYHETIDEAEKDFEKELAEEKESFIPSCREISGNFGTKSKQFMCDVGDRNRDILVVRDGMRVFSILVMPHLSGGENKIRDLYEIVRSKEK